MSKITILTLSCCLFCLSLHAGDSDTTYGRIRIKEKPSSPGSSSSGDVSSDDSDDKSFFSSCMSSCLSGMFDGCLDFIFSDHSDDGDTKVPDSRPQRPRRSRQDPPPERQIKTREIENTRTPYSDSPFHVAFGVLTGGNIYSEKIAATAVIGGNLEVNYFPYPFFGLRLATFPSAGFDKLYFDMEKDVLVNDSLVGTTLFSSERGREFILPLKAEMLIVLPTGSSSLFFSMGGGMSYKREYVSGTRTFNFTTNIQNEKVTFFQWCPNVHFGIGFFIPFDGCYGILELGYSLFVNSNNGRFETPGDNAPDSDLIRFSFSLSTP